MGRTFSTWPCKILVYVVLIFVLLAPYYRALYFPWERALFFVLLLSVCSALTFASLDSLPPRALLFPLFAFLCLYGVNIPFSAHWALAYRTFLNYGTYTILFTIVFSSSCVVPAGLLLVFIGVNAALMSLLGYLEYFGLLPKYWSILGMSLWEMFVGGRLHTVFQYPNTASAYLALACLALFGVLLATERRCFRFFLRVMLFLVCTGIVFTYSRGGAVAFLGGLGILFLLLPCSRKMELFLNFVLTGGVALLSFPLLERFLRGMSPLFWVVLFSGAGCTALLGFLGEVNSRPASRFFAVFTPLVGMLVLGVLSRAQGQSFLSQTFARFFDLSLKSHSIWERLVFWHDALKIFAKRPLTGWGGGGWEAMFLSVRSFPYFTRTTHNLYLGLLVEVGLVGLALFLCFMWFLLSRGFVSVRVHSGDPLSAVLVSMLCTAYLHGIFDFDFDLGAYQLLVWYLGGYAARMWLKKRVQSCSLVPLKVFVFCFLAMSVFFFLAEREKQLGDREYLLRNWKLATAHYQRAVIFEPWNGEYRHALGFACYQRFLKQRDMALLWRSIAEGEKALHFAPFSDSLAYFLGECFLQAENFPAAKEHLERALLCNPFEVTYYLKIAEVCLQAGKYFLQRGEREKAADYLGQVFAFCEKWERVQKTSLRPLQWDREKFVVLLQEAEALRNSLDF